MSLDARRGAGFPPELYDDILRGGLKTQVRTKQTGPLRKPQENPCKTRRLRRRDRKEKREPAPPPWS